MANKYFTMTPNICESSVRNVIHVTILEDRILRWLLGVGKFVYSNYKKTT